MYSDLWVDKKSFIHGVCHCTVRKFQNFLAGHPLGLYVCFFCRNVKKNLAIKRNFQVSTWWREKGGSGKIGLLGLFGWQRGGPFIGHSHQYNDCTWETAEKLRVIMQTIHDLHQNTWFMHFNTHTTYYACTHTPHTTHAHLHVHPIALSLFPCPFLCLVLTLTPRLACPRHQNCSMHLCMWVCMWVCVCVCVCVHVRTCISLYRWNH